MDSFAQINRLTNLNHHLEVRSQNITKLLLNRFIVLHEIVNPNNIQTSES